MKSLTFPPFVCVALLCTRSLIAQAAPPPPAAPPVPPAHVPDVERITADAQAAALEHVRAAVEHSVASADHAVARALAMAQVVPEPPPVPHLADIDVVAGHGVLLGGQSPAARPMLVAGAKLDSGAVAELEEDLRVMSRILDKAVEKPLGKRSLEQAMGIYVGSWGGSRGPQCLYLEGYGALFFVNVRFPLVPPSEKAEPRATKEEDSLWEETRRELRGERRPTGPDAAYGARVFSAEGPVADYDAERVETLKTTLIDALRNAANLRHLKAGDTVTVAVSGTGATGTTRVRRTSAKSDPAGGRSTGTIEVRVETAKQEAEVGRRSPTLTISAKKSDIDAFAKGEQDESDFRKKVSVQVN
jgi:hypothetical protein